MGPYATTSMGAYSALLLQIGAIIISVPAVVLPNNNYTLLIGTSLLKNYGVNVCHKNNEFTILGHSVPLHYNCLSTQKQQSGKKTVNLVYSDGVVPVLFNSNSRHYRSFPTQIFEYKGIPLKADKLYFIDPGHQVIVPTLLNVEIPPELIALVESLFLPSQYEPYIAPGILLPGSSSIQVLAVTSLSYPFGSTKARLLPSYILCLQTKFNLLQNF